MLVKSFPVNDTTIGPIEEISELLAISFMLPEHMASITKSLKEEFTKGTGQDG